MMNELCANVLKVAGAVVLAPVVGGLLAGIDRKISARMQRRKGPPLLQPFYDVLKLMQKRATVVNAITPFYLYISLFFAFFTLALFVLGMDMLLIVFAITLSSIFLVIAGYSTSSPYSIVGTERELIQLLSYEPMIIIAAMSFYYSDHSFRVSEIVVNDHPAIVNLPLVFVGLIYVLTFKLRKSPFDLSTSHHGHQEIVKGITTEFNSGSLAILEITHWVENVFALGLVYVFIAFAAPWSRFLAVGVCLAVYFMEIFIDNVFARVKWRTALFTSWAVTAGTAGLNFLALAYWPW